MNIIHQICLFIGVFLFSVCTQIHQNFILKYLKNCRWTDAQSHHTPTLASIMLKMTILTTIVIIIIVRSHIKIQTLQTQRQTHFTDSQPCFINEMEKQSKNMIYRSLYITKITNVHKTVFTHQTTALKMFCHRKKPHRYHSKVHKKTFRKESYNLFKTDIWNRYFLLQWPTFRHTHAISQHHWQTISIC